MYWAHAAHVCLEVASVVPTPVAGVWTMVVEEPSTAPALHPPFALRPLQMFLVRAVVFH
jgi:hypothetical protein